MHGWEPDTPAEDTLLRRFVLANASHTRFPAEAVGGRTALWDDLSAADAASPFVFDNAAVLLAPPQYAGPAAAPGRVPRRPSGGRGIGAALTWAATLAEPEQPAVLIASDDGQPVYERMGYLRIQRLTMWQRVP